MPAGKRQQSNTLLYTLVTFVGLFIVMTVVAVIVFVKFEEQTKKAINAQAELDKVAKPAEQRKLAAIVGKTGNNSFLGALLQSFDEGMMLVMGSPLGELSAEDKVAMAKSSNKEFLKSLADGKILAAPADPNTAGLLRVAKELKTTIETLSGALAAKTKQFDELNAKFDDAVAQMKQREDQMNAEKLQYKEQVDQVTKNYTDLKAQLDMSTEEQVKLVRKQFEETSQRLVETSNSLLQNQAQLAMAKEKVTLTEQKLAKLVPPPDNEVGAFQPDGKVILIDNQNKIVQINIGSNNHVYQGLTFSVYDKNAPIPRDGKGKAEIEVYNVGKDISAARIIRSEISRAISPDDIIANLIWDSQQPQVFTVAGDFDLKGNGVIDPQGDLKIKALIQKWGGKVSDTVTVNTDFVILGEMSKVLSKPTFEEIEVDPLAMKKYEESIAKRKNYQEVEQLAKDLWIPVFNAERFFYFIGYKTQSQTPGAF